MADLAASPSLLARTPQTSTADLARRGEIEKTAKDFETSFLAIMFGQMFKTAEISAPFGGGQGEEMFKSFYAEAVAKQVTQAGGVGLADTVAREMLKLQGLSAE
ncbi:MAG: rod-binding protein [Phenylobacterium sp.]|jgi:peptidoglycan hydrolase FlgJ|uniref:rod-binding protein n=1 Tax=Phenylobacterium sp. TaxID=1871053 RepID=UPI00391ADECC